jgi:hypothetical protein
MKFIIFVITLLVSNSLFANSSLRYEVYGECPTATDTLVCSAKCKKTEGTQFEFLVNVERSIVAIKTFIDGQIARVASLDQCKVFDSKNWICELHNDNSNISTVRNLMLDGVYSYQSYPQMPSICAK